ncbi:MAG: protein kinase [Deltaproteobacteria bacterium]|nr:protein kinase [Deltaproteobacteria bacterium]
MNCPACQHPNADGARYCAKCGQLLPVAHVAGSDPMIGQVVGGRFRITGLIGEGGMGRVYMGEQQMGTAVRKVAVKTLLSELSRDAQVVERFRRECGTVSELEHPNTIKFYDFGQTAQGELYIAMEFVDGRSLCDAIEKDGALSFERVDKIMKQMCGSLQEAHDKGMVHRDLKPDNVILTTRAGETDFVKVLDFGIAKRSEAADAEKERKLTQAGMVLGTPPYMSPEQFTGKQLDHRSDIYSLGVMAYEMLTGKLPFKANTPWAWATQHMTAQPSPFEQTSPMAAQIPPHMKQAIMRALSKDPGQRQGAAKQFYNELNAAGTGPLPDTAAVAVSAHAGTEAVPALAGPAGAARAGGTQIGEPLFPPAQAGLAAAAAPAAFGAAAPAPAAGYPVGPAAAPGYGPPVTTGGQAVPATRPSAGAGGGKGGVGLYVAIGGVVAVVAVVGIVLVLKGRGREEPEPEPMTFPSAAATASSGATAQADTAAPADAAAAPEPDAGAAASTAAPTAPTGAQTGAPTAGKPEPKAKPDAAGTPACKQAIAAAAAKNCGAARSMLGKCSGALQPTAAANVAKHCGSSRILPPPPPKKK